MSGPPSPEPPVQSLGSVAFGSLLASGIKLVRFVLDTLRRSDVEDGVSLLVLGAAVALKCMDFVVEYFNVFAFTEIALYGLDFMSASKAAWTLLHKCGMDAIINDDIIAGALFFSSLLVAACTGFVGATWAYLIGVKSFIWGAALPCAFAGFIVGVSTMNVVEVGLMAVRAFVRGVYCQFPSAR